LALRAREVRGVVRIATSLVERLLRIGTKRSCERFVRIERRRTRADQPVWCDTSLDPALECREDIALRFSAARCCAEISRVISKVHRSDALAAMTM